MINSCCWLGLNVILISRTKEKLEQVAKEIQNKNSNVQVKTIAVDFTSEIRTLCTRNQIEIKKNIHFDDMKKIN